MHSTEKVFGNFDFDIKVPASLRVRGINEGQSPVRKKMLERSNSGNQIENQQMQKSAFRIYVLPPENQVDGLPEAQSTKSV